MKKQIYIDLMDKVLDAYTAKQLIEYIDDAQTNGITEHGFPRLAANIGILISHGKKTELRDIFEKMMDICCHEIPICREKNGWAVGNDFSVKEIVFCILEIEKSGIFSSELTNKWRSILSKIEPEKVYTVISPTPPERVNNWAAFGAASEQLRMYAKIANEKCFIDNQIKSQLLSFDENGMYRDPNEPVAYDLVTRLQLAIALYFGYDGEGKAELENYLLKSADLTLKMQSVTGEIPYGGRSNQFLHNEAFYATLCEYYASVFKNRGDLKKAGEFKYAARLAIESIIPWLYEKNKSHIKNYYPKDSMYGCESYAYYKKYMVTTASMLYLAYAMSEDIDETIMERNHYICQTSDYFHKVFIRFSDYFLEFDTDADEHYDATGLGRIHKKGVPSALCLSLPFSAQPEYKINNQNPGPFSIHGVLKTKSKSFSALDNSAAYKFLGMEEADMYIKAEFACVFDEKTILSETYTLSETGIEIRLCGKGDLSIMFPAFLFDGKNYTDINTGDGFVSVEYKGHICTFVSPNTIKDISKKYENRNGIYKGYAVVGENDITLNISMK